MTMTGYINSKKTSATPAILIQVFGSDILAAWARSRELGYGYRCIQISQLSML
eukprot:SAG22_NODE_666_length_8013_cov_2.524640_2_plen_53_part_00